MKQRLAAWLRELAEMLDRNNTPKLVNLSFTFEENVGMVIHHGPIASGKEQIGCQLAYLHDADYKKAFEDSGRRDRRYISVPLRPAPDVEWTVS